MPDPLPNRIREYRKDLGLTLEAVAERVGTTKGQIQKLEAGDRELTLRWMERIAPVLRRQAFELILPEGVDTRQVRLDDAVDSEKLKAVVLVFDDE